MKFRIGSSINTANLGTKGEHADVGHAVKSVEAREIPVTELDGVFSYARILVDAQDLVASEGIDDEVVLKRTEVRP
jgi:hypothetical protein